jgi:hypothetical protein
MDMFPGLKEFPVSLEDKAYEIKAHTEISSDILNFLYEKCIPYFSDEGERSYIGHETHLQQISHVAFVCKEQLTELSCDMTIKDKFLEVRLHKFWL